MGNPTPRKKIGMHLPVMCLRCARIYMYENQPAARCPKCGFGKWVDPRMLCKDMASGSRVAIQTVTEVLWKASDFVESGDINEDTA
jgi:DNA-directed RNA polymerase subunit RPC12/RpoP